MSDDQVYRPENRDLWVFLGLQGGFVNLGAFLAIGMLVVHVTGSFSFLGQKLALNDGLRAFFFLLILLSFFLGAFASSLLTEIRRKAGLPPAYPHMMFFLAALFLALVFLAENNLFGSFGETVSSPRHYLLVFLLAFASGVQNAVSTQFTKAVVRTTHLTGPLTDLGIGAAKVLVHSDDLEAKKNTIRLEVMLAFIVGSFLGALAFPAFGFRAFLVPSVLSLGVAFRLLAMPRQL